MTDWYDAGLLTILPDGPETRLADETSARLYVRRQYALVDLELRAGPEKVMFSLGCDTARELFGLLGAMLGSPDFEGYRGISPGDD